MSDHRPPINSSHTVACRCTCRVSPTHESIVCIFIPPTFVGRRLRPQDHHVEVSKILLRRRRADAGRCARVCVVGDASVMLSGSGRPPQHPTYELGRKQVAACVSPLFRLLKQDGDHVAQAAAAATHLALASAAASPVGRGTGGEGQAEGQVFKRDWATRAVDCQSDWSRQQAAPPPRTRSAVSQSHRGVMYSRQHRSP